MHTTINKEQAQRLVEITEKALKTDEELAYKIKNPELIADTYTVNVSTTYYGDSIQISLTETDSNNQIYSVCLDTEGIAEANYEGRHEAYDDMNIIALILVELLTH